MKIIKLMTIVVSLICMFFVTGQHDRLYSEEIDLEGNTVIESEPVSISFIEAIKSGNAKSVEDFIKSGANVNEIEYVKNEVEYESEHIYTPLLFAIEAKNENIVKMLLDAGADANAKREGTLPYEASGYSKITALILAVRSENANIVKMLLDAGADVNVKVGDINGFYGGAPDPALIEAILSFNKEILKMILEAGADLNIKGFDYSHDFFNSIDEPHEGGLYGERYAIEFAVDYANEEIIKMFIEASKDIQQKAELISIGIYVAAKANDTKKAQMLINMGTGLKLDKDNINLALLKAAGNGNETIVRMLLEAGADNFSKALIEAAEFDAFENEEVLKMLLEAGADLNETKDGVNAYMQAVINHHRKTAKFLADKGASTDKNVMAEYKLSNDILNDPLSDTVVSDSNRELVYKLNNALVTAVKSNNELGVEMLLKAGVSPNSSGKDVDLLFMRGVLTPVYSIDLEKTGMPPRTDGYFGYATGIAEVNPFLMAIRNGNEKIVKMFLDAGVDVNEAKIFIRSMPDAMMEEADEMTPLEAAVRAENEKIFFMLIEAGADLNPKISTDSRAYHGESLLEIAIRSGKKNIENFLIENRDSGTSLIEAVKSGDKFVVERLIKDGADLNIKDEKGYTALMTAMTSMDGWMIERAQLYCEITKMLINAGAAVDDPKSQIAEFALGKVMQSALGYRFNTERLDGHSYEGSEEIVKILLKAGVKPDINANVANWTPLMISAALGKEEFVRLLIEYGADVNFKQSLDGNTPLMNAAGADHEKILEMLIKSGADINLKNNRGHTALSLAVKQGNTEAVKVLLKAGADVNLKLGAVYLAEKYNNLTALFIAADMDKKDIIKILVENGADITLKDKLGKTAYDYWYESKKRKKLNEEEMKEIDKLLKVKN